MSIALPTEATVIADGKRVILFIRQGGKAASWEMPPRAALEISVQLERAAKQAKQIENIENAQRGIGKVS